ncbi:MAG: glycosyltransferase, partial [Nitrospirae bacterium]|nr:glycosyltransferase [Nitrospirota bacterium]
MLGDIPLNYIRLEKNTGRAHAGNVGIENAKGDYIGFLDDDDEYYPEHLFVLVSFLKETGHKVAYGAVEFAHKALDGDGRSTISEVKWIFGRDFSYGDLVIVNYIPLMSLVFDVDILKRLRFDESFELYEDWDLLIMASERTDFYFVNQITAVYNQWSSSQIAFQSPPEVIRQATLKIYEKHLAKMSPEIIFRVREERAEKDRSIAEVNELILEKEKVIQLRDARITEIEARENSLESKVAELDAEVVRYQALANAVFSSKSWKLTAPLRRLRRVIGSLFNKRRFVIGLASLRVATAKTYWFYRKSGLKATIRRIKAELYFGVYHSKSLGSSLYSPELLDIVDVQPVSGGNPGRIAVHAHVYYPDLTKELASYLKNIPFIFDLFVSVSSDEARDICYQEFSKLPHVSRVIVDIVENRGRDIAPMVCHFGVQLAKYDYFCHIHTKKSLYSQVSMAGWREYLFRQLLGSEDQVRRIFTLFLINPDAGIVYPQNYEHLPYWGNTWLSNRVLGYQICRQMGIKDVPEGYFDYPAGSMFWARSKAIQDLFSVGIKLTDFPVEAHQTDGSLAHCVERLLVLIARNAGYKPFILRDPLCPSWSKWRLDRYMERTCDYVKKVTLEASNIKVVAFDIFDTLLIRPVIHPETTKTIIEHRLQESGGSGFAGLRANAEGLARTRLGRDVALEDIYCEFASLTGKQLSEVEYLRSLEEHIELKLVAARPDGIELFNHAIRSGKRVILVSDMFLPRAVVERMLTENGIEGYQALFLSSDIGVRKDTGELYRLLLERENISPSELLMVGDNEHSDVQIPLDLGIQVCHVLRPVEIARGLYRFERVLEWVQTEGSLDEQLVLGLVVTRLFQSVFYERFDPDILIPGGPEHIGYAVVGPVVLSFCLWLMEQAKTDGIEKLYFLAREGQLLKEVYDRVARHVEDTIPSEYLVVSRRTVTVAMIESFDDICRIARDSDYFPNELKAFIGYRYGVTLDDDDVKELCRKGLWQTGKSVEVRGDISHLMPVLKELAEKIFAGSRAERPGLTAYLNSIGLNDVTSAAVVDVGYSGTIQGMLSRLLKKPIHGYYMLTSAKSREICQRHDVFAQGYYGSQLIVGDFNVSPLWRRSFELETFLSSNDPQVICYDLCNDGQLKAIHQEPFLEEQGSLDLRNNIRLGVSSFIDDFFAIQRNIYPDLKLPSHLPEMLFGEFVERMSISERGTISGLALDDHYCGRGIVRLVS